MRPPSSDKPIWLFLITIAMLLPSVHSKRLITSTSLNPCQQDSLFTAQKFNVTFSPDDKTVNIDLNGISSISGNVVADFQIIAYGYTAFQKTLDPCKTEGLAGMCPMNSGPLTIPFNIPLPDSVIKQIPSIAYSVPDLDGLVKIRVNTTSDSKSVACMEAELSNGKTVDQKAVGWTTAVIAGLALLASAVTSGLGHSNTAAHVAANALSLFGFFQAQAIIGMTGVALPPVVASWTQNFQWTMGIIRVGFLQDICTWYQRSTGGKPSTLLSNLSSASVQVQKRALQAFEPAVAAQRLIIRGYEQMHNAALAARAAPAGTGSAAKVVVVQGITRAGFRAHIEPTNIFLTGLIFFMIFVVFTAIAVALFKGFCELAVKMGWFKGDKFEEFRNGWKIVLKGILFRLVLIGYPQICVLCLWELTVRDSAAEVVLALFFFISMTVSLSWAAFKVYRIAKRSVDMHKNPAYILYSDPSALNKWGFLYVQFRATAYYFIMPVLAYILVKALFIAFAQKNPIVQAVGLVIIEAVFLIGVSIYRPWMDKKTNAFNISIAAINFLNVIFLLVFTAVFNQPGIVTGVMGVVFFVINAAFALILLIMVLVSTVYAFVSKNPDTRYQPMRDDRGSFIKSQSQLNTELDALGATARGGMTQTGYKGRDIDDDGDSYSSGSGKHDPAGVPLPPSTANSHRSPSRWNDPPRSPIDASMPMFPSDGTPRHGTPVQYSDDFRRGLGSGHGGDSGMLNQYSGYGGQQQHYGDPNTQGGYRQQNNTSPWQRGAGYDH